MKFEEIRNESDIESFFLERKFKPIEEPDLFNEDLESISYYYYEMDEDGDNFGVFVIPKDFNISLIKKELLKNFTNLYQIVFYDSFKEFLFIQEMSGTDKVVTVRKKKQDINQIFLDKINTIEFGNLESFEAIFDRSEIIKEFYQFYVVSERYLSKNIKGIPDGDLRDRYAQVILNRLMFLWFLQVKGFLNHDFKYLITHFKEKTNINYYKEFLRLLFFEGLCKEPIDREEKINTLIGDIPYLNGGLFLPTEIELKFGENVEINNKVFYKKMNYPLPSEITELPVLNLLESKPWTVDENSGDINEINPEILGFIFEKSINKKALGAVYTPESITSLMSKLVLIEYLNSKLGKKYSTFNEILTEIDPKVCRKIIHHMYHMNILDPAVGSGHFLLSLLFHLEKIYNSHLIHSTKFSLLLETKTKIRKHIISNNLFGVDILKTAIEICKLRLFLALAEKYETIDDIEPLPNIEFYFRSGDSVIGIAEKKEDNLFDFIDKNSIKNLLGKRNDLIKEFENQYGVSSIESRNLILRETEELQKSFTRKLLNKSKMKVFKKNYSVSEFNQNFTPFHWSLEFSEILFSQNGFDIIIGNPPYIDAINMVKNLPKQREIIKNNFNHLKKKWDIYVAFIERSLYLSKQRGIISFIIPDSFLTKEYAKSFTKEFLSKHKISRIDHYPNLKIFQNVSVYNIIITIQKTSPKLPVQKVLHKDLYGNTISKQIMNKNNIFTDFGAKALEYDITKFFELGDICYNSVGIVFNADEKRWRGLFQKEDLISDFKTEICHKELLSGKHIDKFAIIGNQYVEWNSDRVPSKVRRPTFKELHYSTKLITNSMGELKCALDDSEEGYICDQTVLILKKWEDLRSINNRSISNSVKRYSNHDREKLERISSTYDFHFLLAILNSKLAQEILDELRGKNNFHITPLVLRRIPIPKVTKDEQAPFIKLTKTILNLKNNSKIAESHLIEKINKLEGMIVNLYNKNQFKME